VWNNQNLYIILKVARNMSWYQSKNLAIAELVGLLDRQTQGEDVNSE